MSETVFESRGSGEPAAMAFAAALVSAFFLPILILIIVLYTQGIADLIVGLGSFNLIALWFIVPTLLGLLNFGVKIVITEEDVSKLFFGEELWSVPLSEIESAEAKESYIYGNDLFHRLKISGKFGTKEASIKDYEAAASIIDDRI